MPQKHFHYVKSGRLEVQICSLEWASRTGTEGLANSPSKVVFYSWYYSPACSQIYLRKTLWQRQKLFEWLKLRSADSALISCFLLLWSNVLPFSILGASKWTAWKIQIGIFLQISVLVKKERSEPRPRKLGSLLNESSVRLKRNYCRDTIEELITYLRGASVTQLFCFVSNPVSINLVLT